MGLRRICALLLLAAALLWSCPALAFDFALEVHRADGTGESVSMWEREGEYGYLFLPAYMADSALIPELDGADGMAVGDTELVSGQETALLADGAKITVRKGKQTQTVCVLMSANLPAVHLCTESGSLDYIHKVKGNKESGGMRIVTADGETAFNGALDSIKGHGNATFKHDKKSYQIKLDEKTSLLGMDAGKSYVLLANHYENTLLRNRLTFALADALDLDFTPDCRSVDLYVNGDYLGSYLLADKVSIASSSVDITESEDAVEDANEAFIERGGEAERYGTNACVPGTYKGVSWPVEPEDITGGYLLELEYSDRYKDETSGIVTERGQPVVVKEPEEMTAAQGAYINALVASFERAIFAGDGVDEQTGKHYTDIADFDSLVRKYMVEEICRNYDGNKSSQYFYKDTDEEDPLLYAGPVWDYDSAWGNYAREDNTYAALPRGLSIGKGGAAYSWWPALYRQEDFLTEVKRVYAQEARALLEVAAGLREPWEGCGVLPLDAYVQELSASANMNFTRWRVFNVSSRAVKTGRNYEENIGYLRSWIIERMAYLDSCWLTEE